MKKENCVHESFNPIAYSDGQCFVNDKEVFTTPYALVKCSDCSLITFGWLEDVES